MTIASTGVVSSTCAEEGSGRYRGCHVSAHGTEVSAFAILRKSAAPGCGACGPADGDEFDVDAAVVCAHERAGSGPVGPDLRQRERKERDVARVSGRREWVNQRQLDAAAA